ncbi:hypothetical protein FQZ97_819630 [compost metagenome]
MFGEQAGDVADDARAVIADQVEMNRFPVAGGFGPALLQEHANALGAQALQRLDQFGVGLGRHRDAQNPGELAGHARHATFQPVAAVVGHALGETFDQPGLILGDDG